MKDEEIKVRAVIRCNRKIHDTVTLSKDKVLEVLVDAFKYDVSGAMNAFPTLKRNQKFAYKHGKYRITLEPIDEYVEYY